MFSPKAVGATTPQQTHDVNASSKNKRMAKAALVVAALGAVMAIAGGDWRLYKILI